MKRVLVTGVSGFIGMHLAQRMAQKGYEVYGIMKPSTSRNIANLKPFLEDTISLTCDISDYHAVHAMLHSVDPDVVVHLAALSPVRESFEKPFSYVQANIVGTMNISHAILRLPDFKEKKLVYASTAEVYGIQEGGKPIKETAVLNPSSPYAVTKAATDMYLRMLSRVYDLNATVMRCTNTYGRKLDASFVVEYMVTSMLKGEKVYVGAPNSIRDYMYVDDHVNAYIKAIEGKDAKGEALNAGPGIGITNKELALKIASIVGFDKKNVLLGKYPPSYPLRPLASDQPYILLDNTKIGKILGWKPTVSLEIGLQKTVEFWKSKMKV